MAENHSFHSYVSYQVIATHSNNPDSSELRAKIGAKPFLIGSGKKADLLLDGPRIIPVHVRLLVSTSKQIMLSNLGGDNTVLLNGEGIAAYTPIVWKPGIPVQLGDFELNLVLLTREEHPGQVEQIRPAVITRSSEIAEVSPNLIIDWGDRPNDLEHEAYADTVVFPDETHEPEKDTSPVAELISPQSALLAPETNDESEVLSTEAMPLEWQGLPQAGINIVETLPKDWKSAGKLSAQLPIHPINLVADERVRVPISIKNNSANLMQLRLLVIGIPREWVLIPQRFIEVGPGEVKTADLILNVPPVEQTNLEATIRLSERQSPDTVLMLPLSIVFKTILNIKGSIEPSQITDSHQTYLHLENHTQSTVTIFITGHTETNGLTVQPAQSKVDLAAGQHTQIPITVRAAHRPWLKTLSHNFSVSAQHSTRAPSDYPGIVRVRPRIPHWAGFILLSITSLMLLTILVKRSNVPISNSSTIMPQSPIPLLTTVATRPSQPALIPPTTSPTLRPSPQRASPTATLSLTPDVISPTLPSATPQALDTPTFTDPRPASCNIPIPPEWKPYTVQAGDRVFRLAVNFGTSVNDIVRVNCLSNPRLLQVGQVLLLPQS